MFVTQHTQIRLDFSVLPTSSAPRHLDLYFLQKLIRVKENCIFTCFESVAEWRMCPIDVMPFAHMGSWRPATNVIVAPPQHATMGTERSEFTTRSITKPHRAIDMSEHHTIYVWRSFVERSELESDRARANAIHRNCFD